jgi:hypothetical protein
MRKIIRISSVCEIRAREKPHQVTQRNDAALLFLLEPIPFSKMFFRPEEVHGASGVGYIEYPLPYGDGDIADQSFRFLHFYFAVLYLNMNWFATIKTHRIDTYCLARKKPADCQRFKCSLSEPFLLAINGQAVIGRQVIEWGK